MVTHRDSHLGS